MSRKLGPKCIQILGRIPVPFHRIAIRYSDCKVQYQIEESDADVLEESVSEIEKALKEYKEDE